MSINNKRSYTEYTVTQPTTDFAIGFDDFDEGSKDNILVTLNGVLVESLGYAAIRKNESTVSITPAITEGTVRLTRETDIDEPFHKFTAGALFSAKSMDENFQQVRHSQQEVRDGFVFLEYNTNGIVQASKEATVQAKAATVEATASAVRAESAADTAVQAVGSLQGVVNAATTATTNASTAASQATAATTSAQNATQAANTAKQEAATAAANANAATVDTLAATGRANDAADVVANLVVGKVRAQDVSTVDGSTQDVKNTEFRSELDALPFEGGILADTFVVVDGTLSQRTVNKGVESIAELLTIGNPKDNLRVYVKSYHEGLNKGGGYFTYDSALAAKNDGGLVLNGWVRDNVNGVVDVTFFGAKGDDVTDDTNAFNLATRGYERHVGDLGSDFNRVVFVPAGNFKIDGTVFVHKGQHLKGAGLGACRLIFPSTTTATRASIVMGYGLVDGVLVESSAGNPPSVSDLSTYGGDIHQPVITCINIAGCSIYNMFMTSFGIGIESPTGDLCAYNLTMDNGGAAVILNTSSRNQFINCAFFWNQIDVIAKADVFDTLFSGCTFAYSQYASVDLSASDKDCRNLMFRDCSFIYNGQYESFMGFLLMTKGSNNIISFGGCYFSNQPRYAIKAIAGATNNSVTFSGCTFDGDKTHRLYTQGTTSKVVETGNNNFEFKDCKFKSLRSATDCINVTGGTTTLDNCQWVEISAPALISNSTAGSAVKIMSCTGDLNTPLLDINSSNGDVNIVDCANWYTYNGIIGDRRVYFLPTTDSYLNCMVRVSANTLPAGSPNYRAAALFHLVRFVDFGSGSFTEFVRAEKLSANVGTSALPEIELIAELDNVAQGSSSTTLKASRYVVLSVPSTYTEVDLRVDT